LIPFSNPFRANFTVTEDAEITIEANPGTVSYEALCELRKIGINRISFGVQSANMRNCACWNARMISSLSSKL
jgi:coproporphyrinogen III oxidase-like Fe-S oxidoreductase